MVYIYYIVASL